MFFNNQEVFRFSWFKPFAESFFPTNHIYKIVVLEPLVQVMILVHLIGKADGILKVWKTSIHHERNVLLFGNIVDHDVGLGHVDWIEVFKRIHVIASIRHMP